MKKLIIYIFFLAILVSTVFVAKETISFVKDIILLSESQSDAIIRQERMLFPVVKITHIINSPNDSGSTAIYPSVLASASGFSISYSPADDASLIITNDHFCKEIKANSSLIIENYKNEIIDAVNNAASARVLISDPSLDLCLLYIHGFVSPATIASPELDQQRFEEIFIIGGPAGDFPIIVDTYISSFMNRSDIRMGQISNEGAPFLLTSEQIFPGHSGSPIYNKRGEVIGVIFGALPTYGGVGSSHKDLYDLLDRYEDGL